MFDTKALNIKYEVRKEEKPYDENFVNMVMESEEEITKGDSSKISSSEFDDLWK